MPKKKPILAQIGTFQHGSPIDATIAHGGLQFLKGNSKPYFSLTCSIYERGRDFGGGADHAAILKFAPQLAPLAALHLSDIDGVPMHAESNGWYWLAGAVEGGFQQNYHGGNGTPKRSPEECLQVFAKHVRITDEEAAEMRDYIVGKAQRDGNKAAHALFAQWISDQAPRWQREADECISALNLVVYGDEYKVEKSSCSTSQC